MYNSSNSRTPTARDFAEAHREAADRIRSTYERWPADHPLHQIVPGFLARTLAESLVISNYAGFTEDDMRSILEKAFADAGVSDAFKDVVIDAICDDQIVD